MTQSKTPRSLGALAVILAACTLAFPLMAVGDVTSGAFVGVVKKGAFVVFLAPALLAGFVAGLGALLGFGKGRSIASIVISVLALAVWALLMVKLKDGATAALGMHAMGAAAVMALAAGIAGLRGARPSPAL
jgi:hypothetical protein